MPEWGVYPAVFSGISVNSVSTGSGPAVGRLAWAYTPVTVNTVIARQISTKNTPLFVLLFIYFYFSLQVTMNYPALQGGIRFFFEKSVAGQEIADLWSADLWSDNTARFHTPQSSMYIFKPWREELKPRLQK
jgi:hypothetical protein